MSAANLTYAFLPTPLVYKALVMIEETGMRAIIVVPGWTVEEVVELGRSRGMCMGKPGALLPRLGTLVATMVEGSGTGSSLLLQPQEHKSTRPSY